MKVGVPREVKNHEYRVAITQAGVLELSRLGHEVFIENDAGVGSSITNEEYLAAGATILPTADDVWEAGDLILKVKEPIAEEHPPDAPGPGALHLSPSGRLARMHRCPHQCRQPPPSPTRRSNCRTTACPCWHRCRRWQVDWRHRWGPTP